MSDQLQQQESTAQAGSEQGFTPITSQEDLDRIIGQRVMRERDKYKDYSELKAKAAKFDEIEEASQTELDKATKRVQALEKELQDLKSEKEISDWKAKVAKESGIPADLLRGSTYEELSAHAESIKAAFPQQTTPVVGSEGYRPDSSKGMSNGDIFASFAEQNLFK